MKFYISGGYHQDPVHRERLLAGMKLLQRQFGDPSFIAVEANFALFQAVIIHQRELFISFAQQDPEMSRIPDIDIKSLSKAILYEADTHEDVFGSSLDVLWLDDYRKDFNEILNPCDMAKRYLQLCRDVLQKCINNSDQKDILRLVNDYNTEQVSSHPIESNKILREEFLYGEARSNPFERDEIWAKVISEHASTRSGYAIVVVGIPHAFCEKGYLGALLRKQGHDCQLRLLAKTGDQPPSSWPS